MTVTTIVRESDVFEYIKRSWSYLDKGGFQLRARPGVYGINIDDAIERIAKDMQVEPGVVRQLVIKLVSSKNVTFGEERLYARRHKIKHYKPGRPSLRFMDFILPSVVEPHKPVELVPPGKEYLLNAWAPEFATV